MSSAMMKTKLGMATLGGGLRPPSETFPRGSDCAGKAGARKRNSPHARCEAERTDLGDSALLFSAYWSKRVGRWWAAVPSRGSWTLTDAAHGGSDGIDVHGHGHEREVLVVLLRRDLGRYRALGYVVDGKSEGHTGQRARPRWIPRGDGHGVQPARVLGGSAQQHHHVVLVERLGHSLDLV